MTEPDLLLLLEARTSVLEKQMKKASAVVGDNAGKMERRVKQSTNRMEQSFASASSRIAGFGRSMAAGFVGGLAAGGITGIVGQLGEVAKGIATIGDEAKRAGLSIEAFQELRYVAEQNRLGVDSLVDGIKELNLRADEFITTGGGSAAEAFQRLGYGADTLKAKLADPSALFTEMIGKLGQLDRAAAIRVADEIFGGTGGEKFVQLIDQGADAIRATIDEAHDLGIIMSDELVAKADELDRRFNALANTVGSALKSAIVGASLALSDFIAAFNASPGMQYLQQATAPLEERGLDIMQSQLAKKEAVLSSGEWLWDREALEQEVADLKAAIETRLDRSQFDVGATFDQLTGETFGSVDDLKTALNPPPAITVTAPPPGGSTGGRTAGSMREQRDAAAELITELQEELRLVAASDLEQRVNAELRRAGASATDAQKSEIRALVTQIENESQAMATLEGAMDSAKGLTKDFLGGLLGDLRAGVDGVTALSNSFGSLADKLMNMALEFAVDALFGSFGFKAGGVVEAATGGYIRGPGTGTSDSIPARLSNGEYVINAKATAANRQLLDAINAGTITGFANGGLVGISRAIRPANDNQPLAVEINAPITVNGSAGTPEQNADLAKQVAKQFEGKVRGIVVKELQSQMRPGNMTNTRSR